MMLLSESDKKVFPICNISSVLRLFKSQLEKDNEPNLTLLSIVVGATENSMTCGGLHIPTCKPHAATGDVQQSFPTLDWDTVEALYNKFEAQLKAALSLTSLKTSNYVTREIVKQVSDVIWSSLTRSCYKDRAHLQSLYSYLTGNKLDCFGIAFAVVAACQLLGYKDVHLALSEDHAWVVFGENCEETAEVTWHGKTHEDKRGQSITIGVEEKSWLYLNGHPVICTRQMEVAAMVSSINPSINSTMDNIEVATLQQNLMWMLYDYGHLEKYPMALANLGDLEEISNTPGRLSCESLFHKAIYSAKTYYNNQHVYPYTYLGGYFYRYHKYKKALESWAQAASVIKKYNYNREDEEIYKEFLEIANELVPNVIKLSSSCCDSKLLQDPECFGYLLRFYDSICKWEEGSSTPVLHIGWAKPLVNTISKFDAKVRSHVIIMLETEDDEVGDGNNNQVELKCETKENETKNGKQAPSPTLHSPLNSMLKVVHSTSTYCDRNDSPNLSFTKQQSEFNENNKNIDWAPLTETNVESINFKSELSDFPDEQDDQSSNEIYKCSLDFIKCLEDQINPNEEPHPNIAALTAACSENILNPEYLLSGGNLYLSPVLSGSSTVSSLMDIKLSQDCCESTNNSPTAVSFTTLSSMEKEDDSPVSENLPTESRDEEIVSITKPDTSTDINDKNEIDSLIATPRVVLQSEKMKGLKDLLLAKKLNASAIQLQLTAQSQVLVVKRTKPSANDFDYNISLNCSSTARYNKRSRRD